MRVNWYRVFNEKPTEDFIGMTSEQIEEYHINMELNDALYEVRVSQSKRNPTINSMILKAFLLPFNFWYNFLIKIIG